jgi:Protein of unknown function (DUF2628)
MAKQIYLKNSAGKIVIVSTGFSWPAFLFGPLWALAKRQWLLFLLFVLVSIPINLIMELATPTKNLSLMILSLVPSLAFMAVCGFNANRWHKNRLLRNGFENLHTD